MRDCGGTGGTQRNFGIGRTAALLAPALLLALAGCRGGAAPDDPVIAKVGSEKVTESQFQGMARILIDDRGMADEFFGMEQHRGRRNELLSRYIDGRRIVMLAREEGLDGDAGVRLQLEEAATQVYAQALLQRRLPEQDPTDEQLRAVYGELAASQRAKGASVPPFEEAKQFLPQLWKQRRQSDAEKALMEELREKYPATLADEYKSPGGGL
jgi:hypothetical protein